MRYQHAFTLVELMITIAVAAILLTVAIPSFRGTIQNNRITAQANDLVGALNLARAEAVARGTAVTACASTDGTTCSETTTWNSGWIVTIDTGEPTATTVTEGALIRVWGKLSGGATLTGPKFIRYLPTGSANVDGTAYQTATFTHRIPNCTGDQGRDITVNSVGRASAAKASC